MKHLIVTALAVVFVAACVPATGPVYTEDLSSVAVSETASGNAYWITARQLKALHEDVESICGKAPGSETCQDLQRAYADTRTAFIDQGEALKALLRVRERHHTVSEDRAAQDAYDAATDRLSNLIHDFVEKVRLAR